MQNTTTQSFRPFQEKDASEYPVFCLTGFQKTDAIVKELTLFINCPHNKMQEHQQKRASAELRTKEQLLKRKA